MSQIRNAQYMKMLFRFMIVVVILITSSCTTSKQVITDAPEPVSKSYRLPPCHKALHKQLLKSQSKFIPSAVKMKFTNVDDRKEEIL